MALGWHLRPGKDIMSYEAVQKGFQHIHPFWGMDEWERYLDSRIFMLCSWASRFVCLVLI